jgi:hypothetical protein
MKTNVVDALKSNARAGEKWTWPKLHVAMLVVITSALAVAGCETMESGPPGAVVAPSSPWPAAATGHSASYAGQSGFASSLSGQWYHDGKPTSIRVDPDGRNLTIIDENGRRTSGVANSPYELDFRGLKGSVGHGGRRISWNNGTTWTREPNQGGSHSGAAPGQQDISGRWYHDGKPTSISATGHAITITDEAGQSSSGIILDNNITIRGTLHGHLSDDGRRISWSNGTTWTR